MQVLSQFRFISKESGDAATTAAQNGVDIEQMMVSSQFAFGQFELLLDRHEMPIPAQAG